MKQETTVQQEVKPTNLKQLAGIYEVSPRTMKGWLEPFVSQIGEMMGRTFTPKQMRIIYDKLGEPKSGFTFEAK
ncbi:MAG: hypothetical protein ABI378_01770 [Chitinophagaceae bacterium]